MVLVFWGILSAIVTIVGFIIPDIENTTRIMIILLSLSVVSSVYFIVYFVKYTKQNSQYIKLEKELEKKYNSLKNNCDAISEQFKEQTQILQEYRNFVFDLNYQFNSVMTNTEQERFKILFSWYLTRINHLNK